MNKTEEHQEVLPVWLYRKEIHCPACGRIFFDSYPRYTRLRIDYVESDLRPHYVSDISPFAYDITVCFNCGYAMLTDCFAEMDEWQRQRVREHILPKFQRRHYPLVLNREQAEERYKLAQLTVQVMGLSKAEKAYFMLRCAWFYKKVAEKAEIQTNEEIGLDQDTLRFYEAAVQGFEKVYISDQFPIRGMNEITMAYLIAVLHYRLGNSEKSKQWLRECYRNRAITNKENKKIKEKISDLRKLVKQEDRDLTEQ